MSACEAQTFENVDGGAWERLLQKAEGYGVAISGYSGESSRDGFTIAWNYDPASGRLLLQCTDSPWWAPCGMINDKMRELVEKSL